MECSRRIVLADSTYRHLVGCKEEIMDLFLRKFRCEVQLRGPVLRGGRATSVKPDIVYQKRISGGPVVSVWKDDLTWQDVDVVVNAANDHLDHAGGLARALVEAGGADIEKHSKEYIKQHGVLKTGQCAVTRAGNLPCNRLLHTVGPVWHPEIAGKCDSELAESIRNIMKYVSKNKDVKSVAIPAVSSGIFRFPLQQCADIIVKTIHSSMFDVPHLKEVRLVNNNDPAVRAMKSACQKTFGPSEDLSGATSASSSQTRAVTCSMTANPQPSPTAPSNWSAPRAPPTGPSYEAPQSITIHGLTLHLVQGLIEEQKTEIIVNSVSSNLDLKSGVISTSILSKAGYKLQEEIRKKSSFLRSTNPNLSMIPTRGFNLPCNFVYHVILPLSSYHYALQALYHVTLECLTTARRYNSRSISFPALGTGNVGLSKLSVAKAMTEAVLHFAKEPLRQLDVYFVIHPRDRDTYQAFRDQLNFHRQFMNLDATAEHRDPAPDIHEMSSESHDTEIPCLVINGTSNEDVEEAEAWLANLHHPQSVSIQNNLVFLFGTEEYDFLSSPDFPDVSVEVILNDGLSGLKIEGPPEDQAKAVIQAERLLLDVQEKHMATLQEELMEAAVTWFYENESGARRYPAKANRELEMAFISQTDITLTSEPHHMISMKKLTAEGTNGMFRLQRRTVGDNSKDVPKRRSPDNYFLQIITVDPKTPEFQDYTNRFKREKLTLVKMEKIQNRYLTEIFLSKKEAKPSNKKTCHVYQVVPRQFTRLICEVGFQRIFSSPKDPKYGHGIYFTDNLRRALECFPPPKENNGPFYIFQAEVPVDIPVDGKDAPLLLPKKSSHKATGDDILDLCDVLVNSTITPTIYVIPESFRANPLCLFTCRRAA